MKNCAPDAVLAKYGNRAQATTLPITARTTGKQTAVRQWSSCRRDRTMIHNGMIAKVQSHTALAAVMMYVNTLAASIDVGLLVCVMILSAVTGKPHLKRKSSRPLKVMALYVVTKPMMRYRCQGRKTSREKKNASENRKVKHER